MHTTWSLQDEIEKWGMQWYLLVLAFLLGAALGWGAAWVFPAPTEARAPLYVAFNTDTLFTSPDDYKNAQFEQVTELLLSEAWLDEVRGKLEAGNQEIERDQLSVEWRNAGRWELVVRDQNPDRAARVAATWRAVAFEHLTDALSHAQTFAQLDQNINAAARHLSDLTHAQTHLAAVTAEVRAWHPAEPVTPEARAALFTYAQAFSVPRTFPAEDASPQTYLDFVTDLLAVQEAQQTLLTAEMDALQPQMDSLKAAWEAEKAASHGLSAFLVVEQRGEVMVREVRSPGVLALVGGAVGVLGLLVGWLVGLSRRKND